RMILAAVALVAFAMPASGADAAKHGIDSNLYTTYEWGDWGVRFTVCGKLPQASGCFGGSQATGLEKACAGVDGKSHQINNTVTRNVYIMDKRKSASDPVLIYAYRRIDTISDTFDDIKFKFLQKVALPITGGASSHCALAANDKRVFAGTDASSSAAS